MLNQLSQTRWIRRLLSVALLGTLFITLRVPAHSYVCIKGQRCPRIIHPPKLTQELISKIIKRYLVENPPRIRLMLHRPVGAYPPAAYADLVRAGILTITAGMRGQKPGPSYGLTAKGTLEVNTGLFEVKKRRTGINAYYLEIPVGEFRYVAGSAVRTSRLSSEYSRDVNVIFKYYFAGNANAARLLRLAPPGDWQITDYALYHGTMFLTTLRRLGRVGVRGVTLRPCRTTWVVRNYWRACWRTP